MTRFLSALLLAPLLALPASAGSEQDVVKLKSGRVLSGLVVLDDTNKDGFSVQRWDTGGTVFVRWTQITEMERWAGGRVETIIMEGSEHVCSDRFNECLPQMGDWMTNRLMSRNRGLLAVV